MRYIGDEWAKYLPKLCNVRNGFFPKNGVEIPHMPELNKKA
jgi:hypothetical protein